MSVFANLQEKNMLLTGYQEHKAVKHFWICFFLHYPIDFDRG